MDSNDGGDQKLIIQSFQSLQGKGYIEITSSNSPLLSFLKKTLYAEIQIPTPWGRSKRKLRPKRQGNLFHP